MILQKKKEILINFANELINSINELNKKGWNNYPTLFIFFNIKQINPHYP